MTTKREYLVEFKTACGCTRTERMMFDRPPDRLRRLICTPFNDVIFNAKLYDAANMSFLERSFALKEQCGPLLIYKEEFQYQR